MIREEITGKAFRGTKIWVIYQDGKSVAHVFNTRKWKNDGYFLAQQFAHAMGDDDIKAYWVNGEEVDEYREMP